MNLPGRPVLVKNGWPFQVDPDDITRIYFRAPDERRRWHTLHWEHAPTTEMPLSEDSLAFARKLAAAKYRYPDDRLAVADLLDRWSLGLGHTLAERRIALRLSREHTALELPTAGEPPGPVLPSVRRALGQEPEAGPDRGMPPDQAEPEGGDDDEADLDDFYVDARDDA
ncbi:hypothetical protein AB0A76_18280 [Streptomyces exfoliatus]|uniref:Uncharacterized protein n=1 Tax=Streptomyces exfoliatus TaxID=1905 RepID=A0ABV3CY45_STREX